MKRLACLVLGLSWLLSLTARADGSSELPAELRPKVEVSVEPKRGLVVGDTVSLCVTVHAKPGVEVSVPEQSVAPFELLARDSASVGEGDAKALTFTLSLLALDPGTQTLPALTLRVVGPKGELFELKTPEQKVEVGSLLANEPNAEPKPPSKPVVVMEDDYTLAWIGGGVLFAALVAVATLLIARWLKRRPKAQPPPPPPRPPWELAVEKLLLLERDKAALLADERGAEFVDSVGDTLRDYLGRRYGFDGLESTTDEVLKTLERLRPHKLSLSGVSLLLEQCDLVKFAKAAPDISVCDDLWNGAMGLVRATTPTVDAPAQDAQEAP
jgi:hypothetical protein